MANNLIIRILQVVIVIWAILTIVLAYNTGVGLALVLLMILPIAGAIIIALLELHIKEKK